MFQNGSISPYVNTSNRFVIRFVTDNVLEAGVTGLNARAGDLLTDMFKCAKPAAGGAIDDCRNGNLIHIVLHVDHILDFSDTGACVFDYLCRMLKFKYHEPMLASVTNANDIAANAVSICNEDTVGNIYIWRILEEDSCDSTYSRDSIRDVAHHAETSNGINSDGAVYNTIINRRFSDAANSAYVYTQRHAYTPSEINDTLSFKDNLQLHDQLFSVEVA